MAGPGDQPGHASAAPASDPLAAGGAGDVELFDHVGDRAVLLDRAADELEASWTFERALERATRPPGRRYGVSTDPSPEISFVVLSSGADDAHDHQELVARTRHDLNPTLHAVRVGQAGTEITHETNPRNSDDRV